MIDTYIRQVFLNPRSNSIKENKIKEKIKNPFIIGENILKDTNSNGKLITIKE